MYVSSVGCLLQAKWGKEEVGMARIELDTERHFAGKALSDTSAIHTAAWNVYKEDGSHFFSF